jgi:hypothetical protein
MEEAFCIVDKNSRLSHDRGHIATTGGELDSGTGGELS